ncbi:hypothetical protein [Roseovarius nanhaiticus]|nr:hypothetical protein [Roseovarius nanhaiticus]
MTEFVSKPWRSRLKGLRRAVPDGIAKKAAMRLWFLFGHEYFTEQ